MWIFVTIFAAACQSARTAYQNTLSRETGFLHATLARSLFGLPLVAIYLILCWWLFGGVSFSSGKSFWIAATICAVAQVLATYFMLRAFHAGGFATGTLLAKTEAVQAAVLAIPLLHHPLSALAWYGIALGVIGALTMSLRLRELLRAYKNISLLLGLASGFCFAVTSVAAATASHALSGSIITRAGTTLCYVLLVQSVVLCTIQMIKTRTLNASFTRQPLLSIKVGLLSSLGSIGWFTGFALVNPALVKTLGQIEILGMLYYSRLRFHETLSRQQWLGGAMILISILLVAIAG